MSLDHEWMKKKGRLGRGVFMKLCFQGWKVVCSYRFPGRLQEAVSQTHIT